MAVSCPEVMYGAYYPYLYGRGAARSFHHAPHFQYDRLNVQSASNAGGEYGGGGGGGGAGGVSSGSASSGAQSPGSPPHAHALPLAHHAHLHHAHAHAHAHAHSHAHTHPAPAHHSPRLRAKEEDLSAHGRASADGGSSESEGECGGGGGGGRARAQYVSANCVVFTHYSGDVAAVVDEHFARALAIDKPKEGLPMASRNLPASFFNAAAAAAAAAVGAAAAGGGACALELYEYDPWHQHYGGYSRAAAAEYANMAGYPPLLLPRSSLHAQYKPVEWPPHAHAHAHHHAHAHAHHAQLDPACAPYSYPAPPGLEAQVQDTSKDLYWF